MKDKNAQPQISEYSFRYSVDVKSNDMITFLSAPEDTIKTMIPNGIRIEYPASYKLSKREIKIHYRT